MSVDTLLRANNPIQYLEQSSITAKQYFPSIFWSEVSICQRELGCFLCQRMYFIRFFRLGLGFVSLFFLKILLTDQELISTKSAILFSPQPVFFLIEITFFSISAFIL